MDITFCNRLADEACQVFQSSLLSWSSLNLNFISILVETQATKREKMDNIAEVRKD